jgi:hypothetical protein
LNQDESDKDCGGVCAATKPCGVGIHCNSEADCESWICSATTGKCVADTVVVAPGDIIDDFEDGNFTLPTLGGRSGNWYLFSDKTIGASESYDVAIINRGASKEGLHFKGKGFTNWGSGVGTFLQSSNAPYDASAYAGVTFWARGVSPVGPVKLNLTVNEALVASQGGACPDTGACIRPYLTFEVTDEWTEHTFAWADFMPGEAAVGTPIPAAVDTLYGLDFGLTNDNMARDLELAVDDFAFTTE